MFFVVLCVLLFSVESCDVLCRVAWCGAVRCGVCCVLCVVCGVVCCVLCVLCYMLFVVLALSWSSNYTGCCLRCEKRNIMERRKPNQTQISIFVTKKPNRLNSVYMATVELLVCVCVCVCVLSCFRGGQKVPKF